MSIKQISNIVALIMILSYFILYRPENRKLNEEYGVDIKSCTFIPISFISGILLLTPAIFGNAIPTKFFRTLYYSKEGNLFLGLLIWVVFATIGFLCMYACVQWKLSKFEMDATRKNKIAVLLYINSGWYGVIFAWGIIVGLVVGVALMSYTMLQASTSTKSVRICPRCGSRYGENQTYCTNCSQD